MALTDRPLTAPSADEQAQIEALRRGDEDAFMALVEKYHASLVRVAGLFVHDQPTAEEVAQETWLAVLRGLDRFEGRSTLKTWIFSILTNLAKTRARRDGRSLPFSALADDSEDEPAVDPDRFNPPDHATFAGHWSVEPRPWEDLPEDAALGGELRRVIREAIEALPPAQRMVISLRDIEGWGAAEVCNALGISETNQRVLLHRARSRVRNALERYLNPELSNK